QVSPPVPQGYSRKAAALEFLQRLEEAKATYEEGLARDPGNEQLLQGLRGVETRLAERKLLNPFSTPDLLARLEADPRTRGLLGDPEYRRLLETLRSDPGQLGARTRSWVTVGGSGCEIWGCPSPFWGSSPQAQREKELGNAAYKRKEFPAALEHYTRAEQLDPTNMTYVTNQAAVYFETGEYERCRALCERAIEVGRENREDYRQIAK
ncbi:STIP1 protein, partial [Nicator chloris]|nr:STIP1 protein [Nicator chloris]